MIGKKPNTQYQTRCEAKENITSLGEEPKRIRVFKRIKQDRKMFSLLAKRKDIYENWGRIKLHGHKKRVCSDFLFQKMICSERAKFID